MLLASAIGTLEELIIVHTTRQSIDMHEDALPDIHGGGVCRSCVRYAKSGHSIR